jgi:hypothetical protein
MGTSERADVASSRKARAGSWCNRRIKARRCCSPGDSISYLTIKTSVSDPDSLRPDPDPAFFAEYRSGSRVLMTKTLKKFTAEKKFDIFFIKIAISLGLHKGRPSYRRSFQPSTENIQHFKTKIY